MNGRFKRIQKVISFFTAGFLPKAKRKTSRSKSRGKIALSYLLTFIAGSFTPPVSALISDRLRISDTWFM